MIGKLRRFLGGDLWLRLRCAVHSMLERLAAAREKSDDSTAAMAHILLVEDNEMNRDMLSRRLERRGFKVTCALDGAEGVAKARDIVPDIILMDMSLPVLDGWEATRQLKSDPATRHIPIIALTAHAMASDEKQARDAGCDDFDTKPVDLARLLGKIEALIAKRPGS